jgi:hypothetical protein
MTYSIDGLIEASDYNAIINSNSPNFNGIWSTGGGSTGYGQTTLATVAQNQLVAASNWNSLITNMASSAAHQGSTITAITPPTADTRINFLSAISTNMSTLNSNRLNAAATGSDITSSGTRTAPWGSGQGIPIVTATGSVIFSSYAAARYFFNAGGTILVNCSLSGSAGTPENLAWVNLCSDLGTLGLPAVSSFQNIAGTGYSGVTKFGGGGSAPTIYNRQGFYDLPPTPQIWYRQYSNYSVYTNDYLEVFYQVSGSGVYVYVRFVDSASFFANTIYTITHALIFIAFFFAECNT